MKLSITKWQKGDNVNYYFLKINQHEQAISQLATDKEIAKALRELADKLHRRWYSLLRPNPVL